MAERRMFAKSIVLSDAFLDMPMSARCLYFTLGMFADDDGFIGGPKSIMRQCGASEDDMRILLAKRYVLSFGNGVIVIKHWKLNNYLRNDRYQKTTYIEELNQLSIDEKGSYTEKCEVGIPNGYQMDTNGIPSIGKDSIEKETISKDIVKKKNATNVATLTQKRKDEFYQSLIPFLEKYEKEMVRDFFEYWSEPNQAKTKMRFEMEKTWDTTRRLATWAKRDNKFNSNGHRFDTTSNYESATERKRREQQEYAGRLAEKISQRISNSSGN